MQRFINRFQQLRLTTEIFTPNFTNYQTVRWARKPMWKGTAPSKLFRVPKRPVIPVEEQDELKYLFNIYRTQMKSIRQFLVSKHSVELQAQADTEELEKAFVEDLARCQEINDKWNDEVRAAREKRVAEELDRDVEYARKRLQDELQKKEEEFARAEEIVRREKEVVATFITRENLDAAIERALNNPVDYNFAIDLDGSRIVGKETAPAEQKK